MRRIRQKRRKRSGARNIVAAVTAAGLIAAGAAVWNLVAAGSGTTGSAVTAARTPTAAEPAVSGGPADPGTVSAGTANAGKATAATTIDAAALGDRGRLAWVQRDGLALYLGPDQPLRTVAVDGSISQVAWSPDGEQLAFLVEQGDNRTLRWVNADSGAIDDAGGSGQAAGGAGPGVGGAVHAVAGLPGPVGSFAWLADGSGWVVSVTLPAAEPSQRSDALFVVPVSSGEVRQLFVAKGDGLRLAGPVSAAGRFAFWRDPLHSASLAADGLPLFVAAIDTGKPGVPAPKSLLTTLPYSGWVRWSPDGTQLLVVAGSGRDVRQEKRLALCDAVAASCNDLPQPSGRVSLDPAFSPDGSRIAFVQASAGGGGMTPSGQAPGRTLVVAQPDGSDTRPLPNAGDGVEAPAWADRGHVLFWRDGGLWLLAVDAAGATPVRVFSDPSDLRAAYFGYTDPWASTAWQARPTERGD